jgi:hypothetical protein
MQSDSEILEQGTGAVRASSARFWMYWVSSVVATLIFLFFMTMMLMVPGVLPDAKLWMLSIAGLAATVSLVIGMWKFGSTEAPVTAWPLGPISGVVLFIEVAMCTVSVVLILHSPHLRF